VTICQYKTEYSDPQNRNVKKHFKCDRAALDNKELCLFHDKTFLQDKNHPDNIQKAIDVFTSFIRDKISDCTCNRIECIGYYLPDIGIHEKFTKPVFVIQCKFQEADFSRSLFSGKAYFSESLFSGKADFSACDFIDRRSFLL